MGAPRVHRFSFPTRIHFGPGARALIGPHLAEEGYGRPLIVTDAGVAATGLAAELEGALRMAGLEPGVFSGVRGNPTRSQAQAGARAFHEHDADSIVGFGGGAALDVAKAVALLATHPGDLFDYEDERPGALPIDGPIPHWVAVPTTAGTGSEVGRSTVISDDRTHVKRIIFSPRLLARAVFADPELTVGLPAALTAATGMDALTHCVEAYLAKGFHPVCDGIALEGLRLISGSLVRAVRGPRDLDARGDMLMGSMMGAIAFQKGLGLTHSCAHALSAVGDLHHGLANALMIDFALRHNVEAVPERYEELSRAARLRDAGPEGFFDWLRGLKREIGIPSSLRESGVDPVQLIPLAEAAVVDGCHRNNPRECTREDFVRIFEEAC